MQEVREYRYRLWYLKDELLRFVGHLDTVNLVVRAMRRAELPLVYTEGFSQKPRLITSPPLPLGFTSRMELMDFALTDSISVDSIVEALKNQEEPRKLIHKVRTLEDDTPKLSRIIFSSLVDLVYKPGEREMTDVTVGKCIEELGVSAANGLLGWGVNSGRLRINCRVHTEALPLGKFAKDIADKFGTKLIVGERVMLLMKDGKLAF